ncbi:MAG TPA: hypothetical protein VFF03_10340 [Rhodocyclaceae bacterium]|nr:hypothetical protein [Rhodocyclaceae bacterium]
MAHSEIIFKHPASEDFVITPVGFSWTTLFFGFLPAIIRGDFRWAMVQMGAVIPLAILTQGLGFVVPALLFGLVYNKLYIRQLLNEGYAVSAWVSDRGIDELARELGFELPLLPDAVPLPVRGF